ncbi:hypothetical protein MXD63_43100, partial [Frankia sp. Cpl3]|nr:hypothetical protein [Frankia sp. Cpl3]
RMLLVDLEEGRVVSDEEIKQRISSEQPYRQWVDNNLLTLSQLPNASSADEMKPDALRALQKAFGYTQEEVNKIIAPMVAEQKDPIGSMGIDTPLAVLSDRPH